MTSILNANLPSDDEEDEDFTPEIDDQKPKRTSNRQFESRNKKPSKITADDEKEQEEIIPKRMPLAKRKEVDNQWQALQASSAKKLRTSEPDKSQQISIEQAYATEPLSGPAAIAMLERKHKPIQDPDADWQRLLGIHRNKNRPATQSAAPGTGNINDLIERTKKSRAEKMNMQTSTENKKQEQDGDGLSNILPDGVTNQVGPKPAIPVPAAETGEQGQKTIPRVKGTAKPIDQEKAQMAAKALAAAQEAADNAQGSRIFQQRRFAGKNVQIAAEVPDEQQQKKSGAGNEGGLGKILEDLGPKKKINVLDKSKMDWGDFKSTNQDVAGELSQHMRSNQQFREQQDFLQRAEVREYEQERDRRLASDIRTRGRV